MHKIAFNVARKNWYRVLGAPIGQALKSSWNVTCLQGDGEYIGDVGFRELKSKLPNGNDLKSVKYKNTEELTQILLSYDFDVIVDADIIPRPVPEIVAEFKKKPLTVLLEGITHPRLQTGIKYPHYDLYLVPSEWYKGRTIDYMSRDYPKTSLSAKKELLWYENQLLQELEESFRFPWSESDIRDYKNRSTPVGTPSLDDLLRLDKNKIRKRLGISNDQKVVGLLPSPWDNPIGYFCGELNMASNPLNVIKLAIVYNKYKELPSWFRVPKDKDLVTGLRAFCNSNDAALVTKLRKSRRPRTYLQKDADMIIGEDGYFPHTSLELFAIADVCFGFCTSGAFECVAAGTSYVDINLPFFSKRNVIKYTTPTLEVCSQWKGAVFEVPPEFVAAGLPKKSLSSFSIDKNEQRSYLNHFTGPCDGLSSQRMMSIIEEKLTVRNSESDF